MYCLEEIDEPEGVALKDVALNLGAKSVAPFREEFHKDLLGGITLLRHAGAPFGESRSTAHFTSAIPRSLENRGPSHWPSFSTTGGPTARGPPCRFEHPYDGRGPRPRRVFRGWPVGPKDRGYSLRVQGGGELVVLHAECVRSLETDELMAHYRRLVELADPDAAGIRRFLAEAMGRLTREGPGRRRGQEKQDAGLRLPAQL